MIAECFVDASWAMKKWHKSNLEFEARLMDIVKRKGGRWSGSGTELRNKIRELSFEGFKSYKQAIDIARTLKRAIDRSGRKKVEIRISLKALL